MSTYLPPHKRITPEHILKQIDSLPKLSDVLGDHLNNVKLSKYREWLKNNMYIQTVYKQFIEKYFEDITFDRFSRFVFELEREDAFTEWKNKLKKKDSLVEPVLPKIDEDVEDEEMGHVENEKDQHRFAKIYSIASNLRNHCYENGYQLGNIRDFENKFLKFVAVYL